MDSEKLTVALRCVLPAVSRDSSREHISCVQVRVKSGVATVAGTDGHRLHVCKFSDAGPEGEWLFRFGTAKVGKCSVVGFESGVLTIETKGSVFTPKLETPSLPFPPWEQVIPASRIHPGVQEFRIDAGYLSDACQAAQECAGRKSGGCGIHVGEGPLDPVKITGESPSGVSFTGIVMPMRA